MTDDPTASIGTVLCLVKDQYGRVAYHPHNDTARHFAAVAGTKTLTEHTLRHALAMGFEIRYARPHTVDPYPQTDFHMEHA